MRRPRATHLGLLVLLALGRPAPAQAQWGEQGSNVGGYLKTLPLYFGSTVGRLPILRDPGGGMVDYTRLRFTSRSSGDGLYVNTAFEVESYFGDLGAAGFFGQPFAYPRLLNLRFDMIREERTWVDMFVDRLNVEAYAGRLTATIGRQRIAWGSGTFWNPTDVFNPFGPLALDQEDRTGVDGVRLDWQVGAAGGITFVHVLTDLPWYYQGYADRSATVLRAGTGIGEYDVTFLAAFDRRETTYGLDVRGYLGDAGLYLESAHVTTPNRVPQGSLGPLPSGTITGHDVWTEIVAGLSYGFAGGATAHAEWFHHGGGTDDPDAYRYDRIEEGRFLAVGRDYAALLVSIPVSPLVAATLTGLRNVSDRSWVFAPGVDWSAGPNTRVAAGVQAFLGPHRSEFGYLPLVGYARLRLSF